MARELPDLDPAMSATLAARAAAAANGTAPSGKVEIDSVARERLDQDELTALASQLDPAMGAALVEAGAADVGNGEPSRSLLGLPTLAGVADRAAVDLASAAPTAGFSAPETASGPNDEGAVASVLGTFFRVTHRVSEFVERTLAPPSETKNPDPPAAGTDTNDAGTPATDGGEPTSGGTADPDAGTADVEYRPDDPDGGTFVPPPGWVDLSGVLPGNLDDTLTGVTGRGGSETLGRTDPQGGSTTGNPSPEDGGTRLFDGVTSRPRDGVTDPPKPVDGPSALAPDALDVAIGPGAEVVNPEPTASTAYRAPTDAGTDAPLTDDGEAADAAPPPDPMPAEVYVDALPFDPGDTGDPGGGHGRDFGHAQGGEHGNGGEHGTGRGPDRDTDDEG